MPWNPESGPARYSGLVALVVELSVGWAGKADEEEGSEDEALSGRS